MLLLFDEGAAGGVGAVPQPVEGVVGVAGRRLRQLVRGGLDEPDLHDVRLPLDAGLYMLPALSLVIVSAVQLPASTFSISMYSRKTLKLYLLYSIHLLFAGIIFTNLNLCMDLWKVMQFN